MSIERSTVSRNAAPDSRPAWVILVAVIALTLFYYLARTDTIGVMSAGRNWSAMTRGPLSSIHHNLAAGVILGLIPLLCARGLCAMGWRDLGLGPGRHRQGLIWLAIGIPVAILAARLSSGQPEMQAVYPLNSRLTSELGPFVKHAAFQLVYYSAWEILFRGVLLNGLQKKLGFTTANIIQTALSVVAHFGRPFTETAAAIPAGLAFGGVAHRTGSVWYVVIIHWAVGVAQDWFMIT
jgi:membrane protease YdiL (CAAX protease family)